MTFRQIETETIYTGKVFRVRIARVRFPDGSMHKVDVVEHGGAAAFLPVDTENRAWLVRQYRHPAGSALLEIPAGTLEPGEDPGECVVRECREEIGMHPGKVTALGHCFLAPGYSSEKIWLYLVEKLTAAPLPQDEDENISVEKIPMETIPDLVRDGTIIDAKTITALYMAGLMEQEYGTAE